MEPWSMERRKRTSRKIEKEAARAAIRLGAQSVVIVAFFADGEFMHMQDGGDSPMPLPDLYRRLISAREILDASGGKDVALS